MEYDSHKSSDWTGAVFKTDQCYELCNNCNLVEYVPYINAIKLYGLTAFSNNQEFLYRRNQDYKE